MRLKLTFFVFMILIVFLLLGSRKNGRGMTAESAGLDGASKAPVQKAAAAAAKPAAAFSVLQADEQALEADSGITKGIGPGPNTAAGVKASQGSSIAARGGFTREELGDYVRRDIASAKALANDQQLPEVRAQEKPGMIDLFTPDDLAQLKSSGAIINDEGNDGLIRGISSRRRIEAVAALPPPAETPAAEAEATPTPSSALSYTGQARGYAMLYLMQANARRTVERELQTLLDSGLRELFLGVLVDGTFGKDFAYLAQVVRRLNSGGRALTLALYLSNGATMRAHDSTSIDTGLTRIEPLAFRSLIRDNPTIRARFLETVNEVKPIYELNKSLNYRNHNIAVVMLEDNLQADSYLAMRELARSALGDLVEYVRNPCEGCYAGNDSVSFGDPIELHNAHEIVRLSRGDGITLDGESFYFPWEKPSAKALSVPQVLAMANSAFDRRLAYFGIWREQRQGISNGIMRHPSQRTYEVPTEEQAQIEMAILREGLLRIDESG